MGSALKHAYDLAPLAVIALILLSVVLVWLTVQWTPFMTGSAVILVLVISLGIFVFRGNFGEALLSLIGGLLSIFAYEWTVGRYMAFSVAWIGFALFALLIASLKMAAKLEDLLKQAAIRVADSDDSIEHTLKRLKTIAAMDDSSKLGPIERAEAMRLFAFRNLPIEFFTSALIATGQLSIITKSDVGVVATFVADFFRSFYPETEESAVSLTDRLYNSIRRTPVSPEEYFSAFDKSRRLIVSQAMEPSEFLGELEESLSQGVSGDDVLEDILARIDAFSESAKN